MLKARLKTIGVSEYKFELEAGPQSGTEWRIVDVGGSRFQVRARRWAGSFELVVSGVFLRFFFMGGGWGWGRGRGRAAFAGEGLCGRPARAAPLPPSLLTPTPHFRVLFVLYRSDRTRLALARLLFHSSAT